MNLADRLRRARRSRQEPPNEASTESLGVSRLAAFRMGLKESLRREARPRPPREPRRGRTEAAPSAVGEVPIMRAFNLLPKDGLREGRVTGRPATAHLVLAVVAFVLLAGMGAAFMILGAGTADKRATRDDLDAELQTALAEQNAGQGEQQPAPAEPALLDERDQRTAALASALGTRIAWDRLLREVSLVIPEDVWLTGLTAAPPAGGAAPVGDPAAAQPLDLSSVTIQGYAYDQKSVARLLSRLAVVPELRGVRLLSSSKSLIGSTEVVQFSMSGLLKRAGAPA